MFDGFWEAFVRAFTVSFLLAFGTVVTVRLVRYLTSKGDSVEPVEDDNNEMTGPSKP